MTRPASRTSGPAPGTDRRTWLGTPTGTDPEELWAYQGLIAASRPEVVLLVGAAPGAVTFLTAACEGTDCGRVVAADGATSPQDLRREIGDPDRALVVLAAHGTGDLARLEEYAALVPLGGNLVVEGASPGGPEEDPARVRALRAFLDHSNAYVPDPRAGDLGSRNADGVLVRVTDPVQETEAMLTETREAGGVFAPSRFWERLAHENAQALRDGGVRTFKRSVNNNYFQWPIDSPRQEEFAAVARAWARRPSSLPLAARMTARDVDWRPGDDTPAVVKRLQRRGHATYVAMLWDLARQAAGPAKADLLEEPALGSPITVRHRGRDITQDLANSLLEYSVVAGHVPQARLDSGSFLEIGAGYGRVADVVLSLHPGARYVIVDIPPALALSQAYLTALHPALPVRRFAPSPDPDRLREEIGEVQLAFLTPNQFAALGPLGVDVAINISSLHEMRKDQVAEYLRLVDVHADGGFFYTKQWATWFNPEDEIEMDSRAYPYPERWRRVVDRTPVAQPAFFETLFAL